MRKSSLKSLIYIITEIAHIVRLIFFSTIYSILIKIIYISSYNIHKKISLTVLTLD